MAVPQMTYPNIPYPVGTLLFASHERVESYLVSYAHRYNLLPYIRFNHAVVNASWLGTPKGGLWNVTFSGHQNETNYDTFEHLIVATGSNHIPRELSWPGQGEWLAKTVGGYGTQREIIHSAWYRRPEKYTNKSILIVGNSASGQDVATETASLVSKARSFSHLC
jgi:cation diffusion facilitator CzcD-associated flavoprotein CzcO